MGISRTAIIAITISGLVLVGGASAYFITKYDTSNNQKATEEVMQNENASDDSIEKPDDAMMEDDSAKAMSNYVVLADYNYDKSAYSEDTKVLFFHASWCTICQGIEKEINADPSQIPEGTVLIKTDFDSETVLRQKYGVTTQYTFVQIDNDGNQIAKWSATSLNKALAGIQS